MESVVSSPDESPDPVLVRRERIRRLVGLGLRVGYGALAAAIVAFGVAFALDFPGWLTTVVVATLVVAIVVLPIPTVLSYGIRAAERDERARGTGR